MQESMRLVAAGFVGLLIGVVGSSILGLSLLSLEYVTAFSVISAVSGNLVCHLK